MATWIQERSPEPWRLKLRPASFRQARFHIETGTRTSGRRIALHEYPKRDQPYAEDMGRRTILYDLTGYIIEADRAIGWDYRIGRDQLIQALETEGPAPLVHPTLGELSVACERYSVQETRLHGGYCVFEMRFVEYGRPGNQIAFTNTTSTVNSAASAANAQSSSAFATQMGVFGATTPAVR